MHLGCGVLLGSMPDQVGHPREVVAHVHAHRDGDAFAATVLGTEGCRAQDAQQEQEQRSLEREPHPRRRCCYWWSGKIKIIFIAIIIISIASGMLLVVSGRDERVGKIEIGL